jgi:polyphosphate kinase
MRPTQSFSHLTALREAALDPKVVSIKSRCIDWQKIQIISSFINAAKTGK